MKRKRNRIINISLSVLSLAISALFAGAGISMTVNHPPLWIRLYGYLTLLYGIATAVLLFFAWKKPSFNAERVTRYQTIIFLISVFLVSLDVGIISPLEWGGLVLVSVMLMCHWIAVKRVSNETRRS